MHSLCFQRGHLQFYGEWLQTALLSKALQAPHSLVFHLLGLTDLKTLTAARYC